MRMFTYSEASDDLASLLEIAQRDGSVGIRHKDGKSYMLQPLELEGSPLDVGSVDIDITTEEIVQIIREGRGDYGS